MHELEPETKTFVQWIKARWIILLVSAVPKEHDLVREKAAGANPSDLRPIRLRTELGLFG